MKFRDDPQFAIGIAEAPVEHCVTSVKKKPPEVRPLHLALESSIRIFEMPKCEINRHIADHATHGYCADVSSRWGSWDELHAP